jgi:glycosyltransferase involved in cell wall biosynthesis
VMFLAAQPNVDLWHLAPRQWTDGFKTYHQELRNAHNYQFIATRTILTGDNHRFIYWPPTLHLREIKPDIIHIEEEPDSLVALECVLACRLWAPAARFALFTWQNIRRKRKPIVEAITRIVLSRVDHAIAGNREAVYVLRQQSFVGAVTILPQLGVDTDVFTPRDASSLRNELGINGFVAGYVGRFVPEKGIDILIEAAAQVKDIHVLLVGRGPYRIELESLAHSVGLNDRFTIIDAVPHHEVSRYLSSMNVLVLPSRTTSKWKEQFGHVLIEAMACGVPVVGSDSGAIPEVINDAGLIFPEGDIDELTDHIRSLVNSQDVCRRLSNRGLERVMTCYTHEQVARKTAQVYESMLKNDVSQTGIGQ